MAEPAKELGVVHGWPAFFKPSCVPRRGATTSLSTTPLSLSTPYVISLSCGLSSYSPVYCRERSPSRLRVVSRTCQRDRGISNQDPLTLASRNFRSDPQRLRSSPVGAIRRDLAALAPPAL